MSTTIKNRTLVMAIALACASTTALANDTDGDGINDNLDVFPWDPAKWALPFHELPPSLKRKTSISVVKMLLTRIEKRIT